MKRILALYGIFAMATACAPKGDSPRSRGMNDLDNAIYIIEQRRATEYDIINAHKYEINVLEQNIEQVNSDGMKQKLQTEIQMKNLGIEKAKKNIANQDVVLSQLKAKRDSLENLLD